MRLYRLCENKGRVDLGSYLALRDQISLREAFELEAALCVIGDTRAEFTEFYQEYSADKRKNPGKHAPSIRQIASVPDESDLVTELAARTDALERATAMLGQHRQAVAYAASGQPEPPGRMPLSNVSGLEQSIASQQASIAQIEHMLAQKK